MGYKSIVSHPEESRRAAAFEGAVLDLCLLSEILGALDRRIHPLDGEESREISRIRGDHDQREEPPHTRYHASRDSPAIKDQRLHTMRQDAVKLKIHCPPKLCAKQSVKSSRL